MSKWIARLAVGLCALLVPVSVAAWSIPGHMLSGMLAHQTLERESPATIPVVRTALEQHPWFEAQWRAQLEKLPDSERSEMLFMLVARWADDIRTRDRAQHRGPWHYINLSFKPEGEPASIAAALPVGGEHPHRSGRERGEG